VPGGAVLSRFNEDPDGLCYSCRTSGRMPGLALRFGQPANPTDVRLWELVAALLLLQRNLRPSEPLKLSEQLSALGIEVGAAQVKDAVRCCERRGMVIEGEPGRAGRRLVDWQFRFSRRRGRRR
jgi:hypothetical protein